MKRDEFPEEVDRIFGVGTGRYYDEIVEFTTAGLDSQWKRQILERVGSPRRVLDLACGTGILTFGLKDRSPDSQVVGVDLNEEYLVEARKRLADRGDEGVTFLCSGAETVPLDGTFDRIMTSYLPKYVDLRRLLDHLRPYLEPGSRLVLHDFVQPRDRRMARFLRWRFIRLREWAARERPEAIGMFETLPEVIRQSDWDRRLPPLLEELGFVDVERTYLDNEQAAIVTAALPAG